jgi:hypothetical protein
MGTPMGASNAPVPAEVEAAFEEVPDAVGSGVFGIIDEDGLYSPFPILDHDLTVDMRIGELNGRLQYTMTLENEGSKEIPLLSVRPELPEGLELQDAATKPLGPIAPGGRSTVGFMVKASFEALTQGVDGQPISGLDTTVRAVLKVRDRVPTYEVTITNSRKWNLRSILIKPQVPYGVVPLEEGQTVPIVKPGDAKTVRFRLTTKEEVDRRARHESRLGEQLLYTPSAPRRRFKGFPRTHSEEELTEMVKRLEELETAILAPSAERIEDIVEMDAHEYGLDVMEVHEPFEMGALEEGFVLIEVPEEALRPMGEIVEYEEPFEEDFIIIDLEEFASIRPLGLEPTITDEIDIEPMELDF